MITTREEYLDLLYRIQDPNRPTAVVRVPENEPMCSVDLNTRSIIVPQEIRIIEFDHNSETLYFSIDRYFDNVDLSTMFAVVQYNNANPDKNKSGFVYPIPYFDLTTLPAEGQENKMLFQWAIEGPAAAYPGKVTFSIKFYRVTERDEIDKNGNSVKVKSFDYVLNTLPAEIRIYPTMNVTSMNENYIYDDDTILAIYQKIEEVSRMSSDIYWIVLKDEDSVSPINNNYSVGAIDKSEEIYNNITQ